MRLIKGRPFAGVGVGGYGFFTMSPVVKGTIYSAHNIYLDLAVDSGILGSGAFLLFLFFLLRKLVNQYYSAKRKTISEITLGFIAAFVAICTASVFGDFILPELSNLGYRGIRGIIYFWASLGIIMGMSEVDNKYEE
jgi:O-antigen ligase